MGYAFGRSGGISVVFGLSWDGKRTKAAAAILALVTATVLAAPAPASASDAADVSVIVTHSSDSDGEAQAHVELLGGDVTADLAIIHGFAARLPADRIDDLLQHPDVAGVVPDAQVRFHGIADANEDHAGSMFNSTSAIRATQMWKDGFTGQGIDVALIDSGVADVAGLNGPNKVINGPDLSFESQDDATRYIDTFGHGTHMAGIIAGRDGTAPAAQQEEKFYGVAPDARIVSVKVAGANGVVDVSQVIAAIDWVVQHRTDNGLNIRVLNLSFGTDGVQSYQLDPLAYAAEVAWRSGVVVVVAAGNDGNAAPLRNPAFDPFVIAAGAVDAKGTSGTRDDTLPSWATCGTAARSVDVVAPGKSILSLRAPGSTIDVEYPSAVVANRLFKGSGTSQAAAFVSGAAALVLSQRPDLTPDQVKAVLMESAAALSNVSSLCEGSGILDLRSAARQSAPLAGQAHLPGTGLGTLEGARGSIHLEHNGVVLEGEQDIFGNAWEAEIWAKLAANGSSWTGGEWNGSVWAGSSWSGSSWSGSSWSGSSWSGSSWSGSSWSGSSWSGSSWSGSSWSGSSWSGASWSSALWG